MELVLVPVSDVGWLLGLIVECPMPLHGVVVEVALITSTVRKDEFAIAMFATVHHHPLIFLPVVFLSNHKDAVRGSRLNGSRGRQGFATQ